jgi:hypothetical protein
MTYPATLAVQAQTFSEYLFQGLKIRLVDENLEYYGKTLASFALICKFKVRLALNDNFLGLLMYLNFFSVKTFVSRFQIAATASKIISTMTIIGIGMYYLIVKGKLFLWKKIRFCPLSCVCVDSQGLELQFEV